MVGGQPAPTVAVDVTQDADASKCTASGDGLKKAVVGKAANFVVEGKNKAGKPAPVDFTVAIAGPTKAVEPKVIKGKEGKTLVSYIPAEAGAHTITVQVDGANIKESPFTATVVNPADASKTTTKTEPEPAVAGAPVKVIVALLDQDGKPVTDAGDEVTVLVVGPNGEEIPIKLKNNGDGTFSGEFTPTAVGKYTVKPTVSGKPAPTTDVHAQQDVDASKCTASGDGLKKAIVGKAANFVVEGKNKAGKPAPVDFIVTIAGPSKAVEPKVIKGKEGKTLVSYTPTEAGAHTITVQADGANIKESPFTATVSEPVDLSKSPLTVDPAEPISGKPAKLTLALKDKNGQPLLNVTEAPVVVIKGPKGDTKVPLKVCTESNCSERFARGCTYT